MHGVIALGSSRVGAGISILPAVKDILYILYYICVGVKNKSQLPRLFQLLAPWLLPAATCMAAKIEPAKGQKENTSEPSKMAAKTETAKKEPTEGQKESLQHLGFPRGPPP
eukprot:COSAG01_NODE_20_length_38868_cov_34.606071_37_plen_111_part_00